MPQKLNDSQAPAVTMELFTQGFGLTKKKKKGGKNATELTPNELNGRRPVTQRGITQRNGSTARGGSRRSPEGSGVNPGRNSSPVMLLPLPDGWDVPRVILVGLKDSWRNVRNNRAESPTPMWSKFWDFYRPGFTEESAEEPQRGFGKYSGKY